MKGKKADPVFIAEFIQQSIQEGLDSPDQIVDRAKKMIYQIDKDIQKIQDKKNVRCKLLDVIETFQKPQKDKTEEAKLLSFFKLQYPQYCREICLALKNNLQDFSTYKIKNYKDNMLIYNFCIKEMIEAQIINQSGNILIRGEKFDEYNKYVFHEE